MTTLQEDGFLVIGHRLCKVPVSAGHNIKEDRMRAREEYRYKPALQRRSISNPFITPRLMRSEMVGLSGDPSGPIANKECEMRDGAMTSKRVRWRMGSAASEAR